MEKIEVIGSENGRIKSAQEARNKTSAERFHSSSIPEILVEL